MEATEFVEDMRWVDESCDIFTFPFQILRGYEK